MQTRMLKETFMTTQSARVSGDGARLKGMRGEKTYMAVKMLIIFFISDFFFEQGEFCVASRRIQRIMLIFKKKKEKKMNAKKNLKEKNIDVLFFVKV